jgi:hypothetical protein
MRRGLGDRRTPRNVVQRRSEMAEWGDPLDQVEPQCRRI